MREVVLVLVGAICSALGGGVASCMALWYQAKKSRQIRMEERAGDQQFDVSTKALALIRELRSLLVKRQHEDAQQFFKDNGSWFAANWMFLPGGFVDGWKTIALELGNLSRIDQATREAHGENDRNERIEKAVAIGASLPGQALTAENALRKARGLKEAE